MNTGVHCASWGDCTEGRPAKVGTKTTKANGTGRESLAMTVTAHSERAGRRNELWLGDWESKRNWQRIIGRNSFIVENEGRGVFNKEWRQ